MENITKFPRLYRGKCAKKYIGKIWEDAYFEFWITDDLFVWYYVETDTMLFSFLMYTIVFEGENKFWCPV